MDFTPVQREHVEKALAVGTQGQAAPQITRT